MSEEDNNHANFSNEAFADLVGHYNGIPVAFSDLLNAQIKSIKTINSAISAAQQSSMKNIKEATLKQRDLFANIMQNTTSLANDIIDSASAEDALKKSTQSIQKNYSDMFSSAKDISGLLRKASMETGSILRDRAKDSIEAMQNMAKNNDDAKAAS